MPSSLSKLLVRRLNLMKDEKEMLKFLASMMLLGTRVDTKTVDELGYENSEELINRLSAMGYLYYYNNCFYFPNYNLLKENLLETMNKSYLKEVANELFEKIFDDSIPSPTKATLTTGILSTARPNADCWPAGRSGTSVMMVPSLMV